MVVSKVASGDINSSMQAFVQVWRVHVEHILYQCLICAGVQMFG